jgi:hypothetical protein
MNRRLLILLFAILAVKAVFLALDPYPALMFGDSASYLATAMVKWIPPDRSFVYGFIIRKLTVRLHLQSLMPVVYFQTLFSAIASWLVAVCLVKYFQARFSVAAACSLLCAVEPMQLMFERFVLPDSLTTSLFAVLMFAAFRYLKRPGWPGLAAIQLIAAILVSLRLNFLPVAIVISILLPLMALAAPMYRSGPPRPAKALVASLLFSVLLSQGLLFGYRLLYGHLIGKPPAYSYSDGSFLIAVVIPILQPADFPSAIDTAALFKAVQYPMSDPRLRPENHWAKGGLCDLIQTAVGNADTANAVMKQAALHAVLRDPVAVGKLAIGLYEDFFDVSGLRDTLRVEEGQFNGATPEQASFLASVFHWDTLEMHFDSLTKDWHGAALPWYWLLLVFPMVYPFYLVMRRQAVGPAHILCAVCALMILLEAVTLVERIVTRYLVAEAWLIFVMIGAMLPAAKGGGMEEHDIP